MPRALKAIMILTVMLAFVGCQDRAGLLGPDGTGPAVLAQNGGGFATIVDLDSAIFSIYVAGTSQETVFVHGVTSDWQENVVTWTSFAGGFDPNILGSFIADGTGWHSVNITSYAQDWLDGVTPNYGLLLEQTQGGLTAFASSEDFVFINHPMLRLFYTDNGLPMCDTIQRGINGEVFDSYIREDVPDGNFGISPVIYTGFVDRLEKQAMVKFVLPAQGCDTAAVGDFVWLDSNCDGIQDRGEIGLPRVTVELYSCSDTVMMASTVTDADGHYLFENVMEGMYFLRFVIPDGYYFAPMDQGTDDCLDSDVHRGGITDCFAVDTCEVNLCMDAGVCQSEGEGCTRTIGYWKNHAGFGPQEDVVTPLLPIWLGLADSASSMEVTSARIAYNVLGQRTYGTPSNGITKLYAQLLAAKLNIANGASPDDVSEAIMRADGFLAMYDWEDWGGLTQEQRQMVLRLKDAFDSYNNGFIGPGHCDDDDDD